MEVLWTSSGLQEVMFVIFVPFQIYSLMLVCFCCCLVANNTGFVAWFVGLFAVVSALFGKVCVCVCVVNLSVYSEIEV